MEALSLDPNSVGSRALSKDEEAQVLSLRRDRRESIAKRIEIIDSQTDNQGKKVVGPRLLMGFPVLQTLLIEQSMSLENLDFQLRDKRSRLGEHSETM